MSYEVDGWYNYGEPDDYAQGCDPDKYVSFSGYDRWKAETIHDLLVKLRSFVGVDDDYEIELDACEEDGRVDISVLETGDSYPADEREIERWKKGELVLWYSTYTFHVYQVERKGVRLLDGLKSEGV